MEVLSGTVPGAFYAVGFGTLAGWLARRWLNRLVTPIQSGEPEILHACRGKTMVRTST